ncbi:MAG: hypothetical protein E7554_02475, partial [Ruminococcaceae bacterium]|nr:hypothetical protein [Oscillospiraceae bacterium]
LSDLGGFLSDLGGFLSDLGGFLGDLGGFLGNGLGNLGGNDFLGGFFANSCGIVSRGGGFFDYGFVQNFDFIFHKNISFGLLIYFAESAIIILRHTGLIIFISAFFL